MNATLTLVTALFLVVCAPMAEASPDQHSLRHGLLDTGRLSKAGRVTVKQHAILVYGTASYGLTNSLEVEVGASLGFAAHARARISLLDKDNPLRIALGVSGTVLNSYGDGAIWLPGAHITAGYRLGDLDLFAHTSIGRPHASPRRLYESHVGAGWTLSENLELVAGIAELGSVAQGACLQQPGKPSTCTKVESLWAAQAGVKIALGPKAGKTTEVELLMIYLPLESSDDLWLPNVSFTHRW